MPMMGKFDYKRYYEHIRTMPEPIMMSELPKVNLDLRGVREYANNKGIVISSLIEEEKQLFIKR